MAEEGNSSGGRGVRVCVTGGAGFIGSWLVRKLLEAGYTVHATLRSIGDEGKAGLLRRLVPGAAPPERLVLFEADLYDAASFAPAIAGCQFVFLVATLFAHEAAASKYKTSAEAAVDAVRVILRLCAESKTVKRVIHTASVSAASPLTKSSTAASAVYRDFISESCWTALDVDYPLRNTHFDKYIESKVLSEKELLRYNDGESPAFEVVTIPLGLVAGDTILSRLPETIQSAVAPVTKQEPYFMLPRIAQRLLGSVSLVHVDDACAALVFCMEQPSIAGRFLCSAAYPTIHDILDHYGSKYPHLDLLREADEVARVQPESNKLGELGFRYKYGVEEILDESIECAVRLGSLDTSKLIVQQE
ncbi:putative anthocyanidin reductase [Triticum dicoccoides]|uniref:putative anthocyanidin reductase n=1 Tax=Triticum dicoccoides TaxID=85692 RepID=UPI000E7B7448|nr:putative anthocyanidin reductase [Triticum dicoccoides]